jgi:integrase/recombinase XerC
MKEGEREELADFLRFCASERRLAPMTCSAYERDVSACLDYLQGRGIENLGEVKVTHLRAFLAEEQKRRPAFSSQARTTAALKCFFRFLVEEERIVRDPALPLRTPQEARGAARHTDDARARAAPRAARAGRALGAPLPPARRSATACCWRSWRTQACGGAGCLGSSGTTSISPDGCSACGRQRAAGSGRSRSTLRSCRSSRTTTRVPLTEQAVFVGVQGNRLHYTQLGQVFRHYVDAAGVNERKRVTPHTLRHVFASELLRTGANLRQIQELLGHKHLDSTQRYTRVNAHGLRGAIRRLRWVGG